ncbi:REC8 meiotic recombination protein b [Austrofundulus limnaeus]|uniref:REC8 meiotic recombination protein b n=1 Tax=Austrofundulus limnaeus TaxID=52670 RepID=A0A2I4CPV9_AUSLI|nr:PREDICTED: meiotic recombination protein REC8 homolog [Austrofundulus limnaeus]
MAQVPAPLPNQPNPRFSLYLSSQLQYGVVVVYHKQCGYLLEETQHIVNRLLRTKTGLQIDMAEADRMTFDLADGLNLMEEAEGAHDPFFGLMKSPQLPSPNKMQQVECISMGSEVLPFVELSLKEDGFVSPPASITMTEKEPVVLNAAECFEGDDLPEPTAADIDFLIDQPDQFHPAPEVEVDRKQSGDRTSDQEDMSSIRPLKETKLGTDWDSEWLLDQQDTGAAVEKTPPRQVLSSEVVVEQPAGSPSEEVVPPVRKRQPGRRGRQLVFADVTTQISDEAMQEQIRNPLIQTQELNKVLVDLKKLTMEASPAQLYGAPCCKSLTQVDLLSLWKQLASIDKLQRSEETPGGQDMEMPLNESGLQSSEGSTVSDLVLDRSKGDRSDLMIPVNRRSPQDIQPPMEPILEEPIDLPEAPSDMEDRNSWVTSTLQLRHEVTFGSVLPPEADRFTAAQKFHKLLELLTAKQLAAHQTEPYDDIIITPGGGLKMDD